MKRILILFLLAVVNIATAQSPVSNCNNTSNVGTQKACSVYVNKRATVAGDLVVDTIDGLRLVRDESNLPAIRLNNRTAYNTAGNKVMLDWQNGYLQYEGTSTVALDWQLGTMYSSAAPFFWKSYDWINRTFYNSGGSACLNYSSSSNGIGLSNIGASYSAYLKNSYLTGNKTYNFPDSSGRLALTISNVASATKLQTARLINGEPFDGTSNVTVTAAANTLTGTTLASNITNSSINTVNSALGDGILQTTGGAGALSVKNTSGSGDVVLKNSPALVTPDLGTPSAAVLTNATGLPISTGVSGLGTGMASFLAGNSSLALSPTAVDNVEGGSGNTTRRLVLSTYQQANQSAPYGDLIRSISEHGSAKGGFKWYTRGHSAQVITTNSEPYNVTTGQTLQLKINGGSTMTVTFNTSLSGTSFTSGAATADQISDIICKSINYTSYPSGLVSAAYYGQASPYLTQTGTTVNQDALKVVINSCTYGVLSSVEVVGGTALTGLGLSAGTSYGSAGAVTFEDATTARQTAWIVSHDYPNNPSSNNSHKHISFEVPDSAGEMQSRMALSYGKNVSELLLSSTMFIQNGYPVTIANSANSFKDLDFSRDNTGRQISRVATIRTDSDANGGNLLFKVYDNSGTPTTLLSCNRLSKFVSAGGAIQEKIRTTANSSSSVMTLSPQNGNSFKLSGTSTVNYIANTDWQAGSTIVVILQGAATLTHNAGSPTSTNRPLKLSGSTNYTAGANGSAHTFLYDGSGYENSWIEISRIAF